MAPPSWSRLMAKYKWSVGFFFPTLVPCVTHDSTKIENPLFTMTRWKPIVFLEPNKRWIWKMCEDLIRMGKISTLEPGALHSDVLWAPFHFNKTKKGHFASSGDNKPRKWLHFRSIIYHRLQHALLVGVMNEGTGLFFWRLALCIPSSMLNLSCFSKHGDF